MSAATALPSGERWWDDIDTEEAASVAAMIVTSAVRAIVNGGPVEALDASEWLRGEGAVLVVAADVEVLVEGAWRRRYPGQTHAGMRERLRAELTAVVLTAVYRNGRHCRQAEAWLGVLRGD